MSLCTTDERALFNSTMQFNKKVVSLLEEMLTVQKENKIALEKLAKDIHDIKYQLEEGSIDVNSYDGR